jgi:ABC-type bacteriocin/lantibiotic exporter with double-glycine peptidase domain
MSILQEALKIVVELKDNIVDFTGYEVRKESIPKPRDENEILIPIAGYRQNKSYTCGFTSGLMILHTFNPQSSIDTFYKRVKSDKSGTSTNRLVSALRESGIRIRVVRGGSITFQQIAGWIKQGRPIITTVKNDTHWVVIFGVGYKPQRIFIAGNGLLLKKQKHTWTEFRYKLQGGVSDSLVCYRK